MSLKVDRLRKAQPHEAEYLSALALRSKAHWGYSREFLDLCRSELAVDAGRMGSDDYRCFVAVAGEVILGFYTIESMSDSVFELEALFVEPAYIGNGVGRKLMQHAIDVLSGKGAQRLIIQGDPNATSFYLAAGATEIGSRESGSIPGRHLPLFEIRLPVRRSAQYRMRGSGK